MTGVTPSDGPDAEAASAVQVTGDASEEELAAIVAAVEATVSQAQPAARPASAARWRFSGRWWSKPVPLRRSRPWR